MASCCCLPETARSGTHYAAAQLYNVYFHQEAMVKELYIEGRVELEFRRNLSKEDKLELEEM
jgi:hypothetical protein